MLLRALMQLATQEADPVDDAIEDIEALEERLESETATTTSPDLLPVLAVSLRRHRTKRGLSLERLSKLSGVSRAMLSQIELGYSAPTINVMWRIACCPSSDSTHESEVYSAWRFGNRAAHRARRHRAFELMGARATTAKARLDRFWRNARTLTLHDPVDYKLKELGAFALKDELPTPTFYS